MSEADSKSTKGILGLTDSRSTLGIICNLFRNVPVVSNAFYIVISPVKKLLQGIITSKKY